MRTTQMSQAFIADVTTAITACATTVWPRVSLLAGGVAIEGDELSMVLPADGDGLGAAVDGGALHAALRKASGDVTLEAGTAEITVISQAGLEFVPCRFTGAGVSPALQRFTTRIAASGCAEAVRRSQSDRVVLSAGAGGRGLELWHPDRPLFTPLSEHGGFGPPVTLRAETLRRVLAGNEGAELEVGWVDYGVTLRRGGRIWLLPAVERTHWRDPLTAARAAMEAHRHRCHLGHSGECRWSDSQSAVLVLGVPRSGKTTGLLVPNIIAWPGPVLTTSSKDEIIHQTAHARGRFGRLWLFDPTGDLAPPAQLDLDYASPRAWPIERLRWSPVVGAESWRDAQTVASEMTRSNSASNKGQGDQIHFVERAAQLIAVLLHAAALDGRGLRGVLRWMFNRELDEPRDILDEHLVRTGRGELAVGQLEGLSRTPETELGSIWSTADRVLAVYNTDEALESTDEPNFDMTAFARSFDTVYLGGTTRDQAQAAPIIVGFLTALREAIYKARIRRDEPSVLWALDEMTNIAPIPNLSEIVSQAGGQQLIVMGVIQDLSQARRVWDREAEGFFGLFGAKVILPKIADTDTLRRLSDLAGKHEVEMTSVSHSAMGDSTSVHKELRDRLPIDRLAAGPLAGVPADGLIGAWGMLGNRIEACVLQPFSCSYDGHGWALAAAGQEYHADLSRILQTLRIEITRVLEATIDEVLAAAGLPRDLWWAVWLGAQGSLAAARYAQVAALDARTAERHLEQLARKGVLRWLTEQSVYWAGPALADGLARRWYPPGPGEPLVHGIGDLANRAADHLSGLDAQRLAAPEARKAVTRAVRAALRLEAPCEIWAPPPG